MCFRVTFLFCFCVTFTSSPICIHLWASMMTQCLSCSPRHFGTGEFSPPQHNKRTITSERYQAAAVCRLTRLGIVERRRSLTQSKHRFTFHFLSTWLMASGIFALYHIPSNTTSQTPPSQHTLSNAASLPVVVAAVPCILNIVRFVCPQLMQLHYRSDCSLNIDHAVKILNHHRCARVHNG